MRNLLISIAILALVAGCQSSRGSFTPQAVKQPGNGALIVYWPGQTWGEKSGKTPEIRLDGASIGVLKYKGYLERELPAGTYTLTLTGDSPAANWDGPERSFPAKVEAGKHLYVRLLVKYDQNENRLGRGLMKYAVTFLPRAEAEARRELSELTKLDS